MAERAKSHDDRHGGGQNVKEEKTKTLCKTEHLRARTGRVS